MIVRADNKLIAHKMFDYLSQDDLKEIEQGCEDKTTVIIGFRDDKLNLLFCAIVEQKPDCLFIREVAGELGSFTEVMQRYKIMNEYFAGLAMAMKIKWVRFNGPRDFHAQNAISYGFTKNPETGEYERKIH